MGAAYVHTVKAGESPAKIAAHYAVSWDAIRNHPDNQFIKEREKTKKYPLFPGDRLTIPNRKLPDNAQEMTEHLQGVIAYLWSLVTQHPSYPWGVKLYSMTPSVPKVSPAKPVPVQTAQTAKPIVAAKPAAPNAAAGYKKKHERIWSSVVLTQAIESAFDVLLPYLPGSVVMTSGYRTDADQERIINEYYAKHQGDPMIVNVEQRRLWLKEKKGLIIAKVGSSPHRTGLAFDLSGANIDSINVAVDKCAKEKGDSFPLQSTIIEKKQNCLHVNLKH